MHAASSSLLLLILQQCCVVCHPSSQPSDDRCKPADILHCGVYCEPAREDAAMMICFIMLYIVIAAKFRKAFSTSCRCCRCSSQRTRRPYPGDSMYSYKYNNDMSQTEEITLSTIKGPGGKRASPPSDQDF